MSPNSIHDRRVLDDPVPLSTCVVELLEHLIETRTDHPRNGDNTMIANAQVDVDVARYIDLQEQIEERQAEQAAIKARLRDLGAGKHDTAFGVAVTITAPSRSFNLTKAWAVLTPEQQAACVSPDAKKVKGQLPPVLLDTFMEPGKGEPVVKIA